MNRNKKEKINDEEIFNRSVIEESFLYIPENNNDKNKEVFESIDSDFKRNTYDDDFFVFSNKTVLSEDDTDIETDKERFNFIAWLTENGKNKNIGIVLAAAAVVCLVLAAVLTFSHCSSNKSNTLSVAATVQNTTAEFQTSAVATTQKAQTSSSAATKPSSTAVSASSSANNSTRAVVQTPTQGVAGNYEYYYVEPTESNNNTDKPAPTESQQIQTNPPEKKTEPATEYEVPEPATDSPVQPTEQLPQDEPTEEISDIE